MRELTLTYNDVEYRCRTTYEVLMRIEDKVTLTALATRIADGAATGDVPVSHVTWVLYCLLESGGCRATRQDVFDAVAAGDVAQSDVEDVIGFVLAEVFGVGPSETMLGAEEPSEDDVKKP